MNMVDTLTQLPGLLAQTGGWSESLLVALFLVGLGLVFLLAELFFISFGVLTLCSICSFVAALVVAFNRGSGWGVTFIALELVLIPVMIVVGLAKMPRTRWGRRLIPASPDLEEVTASGVPKELTLLRGKEGVTLSMCRPSGTAEIDGRRYDVVAEGIIIAQGKPVKVVEVEGNRVVVREVESSGGA